MPVQVNIYYVYKVHKFITQENVGIMSVNPNQDKFLHKGKTI
jgi:hypothetical protein